MAQFITLPSASSTQFWPQNTSSHFRVHLPRALEYDITKNYEVALAQMQYEHAYVNLPKRVCHFEIERMSDAREARMIAPTHGNEMDVEPVEPADMDDQDALRAFYYGRVEPGNYKNARDLVNGVNAAIRRALKTEFARPLGARNRHSSGTNSLVQNDPETSSAFVRGDYFEYSPVSHKVTCHGNNIELIRKRTNMSDARVDAYSFIFHPELCLRLGYTDKVKNVEKYKLGDHEREHGDVYTKGDYLAIRLHRIIDGETSPVTVDHNLGFHNIYIYSDVMKQANFVGETQQSCLRVVPIGQENRHQMVLYEPVHMHFFPIRCNSIRDIEVVLNTDSGEPVPFERGSTVVTLCVRETSSAVRSQ